MPTTIGAEFFDTDGRYRPFSGTFSTDVEVDEYGWMSGVHRFSEDELLAAQAYTDPTALGLPENVPERVRLLAEEITEEHESVYEKARALAWHLRDNYEYAFATEDDEALPEGRDAVDWFLFETRKGTCGQFSSAFVVMARSVGIPARVVSGWVISEGVERQTVYADQAHQWAEVAFEGIGWRRFEPTPFDGAPFRATVMEAWEDELDRLGDKLLTDPDLDERLGAIDELLEYSEIAPETLTDVSDPLIDALGSDEAVEVRAKAAETLGDEGYRNAIDPLISALHEDEAEEVRAEAAKALAKLKGEKAVDALIKALKEDASALVRRLSIVGLASLGDPKAIGPLMEALSDPSPEVREAAEAALKELGADVTRLESGGLVGLVDDEVLALGAGTTTMQAGKPPHLPVFEVSGAEKLNYLRTATGDVYVNGRWTQSDPVEAPYEGIEQLQEVVLNAQSGTSRPAPPGSSTSRYLTGQTTDLSVIVSPANDGAVIAAGVIPGSLDMRFVLEPGVYFPYSSTVRIENEAERVVWSARAVEFEDEVLRAAGAYEDAVYTQLPETVPGRVGELARQITEGYTGTYAQAKAIEQYLRETYAYAFAESGASGPLAGRDPVDWFLFESREGTCGQFSSAFVVLARSVGIPARVVSGWAIGQTGETQTVYLDQAHQWAEVALDEIGWVSFEPTASGPPSRTPGFYVEEAGAEDGEEGEGSEETIAGDDQSAIPESEIQAITEKVDENLDILDEDSGVGIFNLGRLLGDTRPGYEEAAREILEERGASITTLENGASLVVYENQGYWVPGTTTAQSGGLAHNPIFQVDGAGHTNRLRTAVGDLYQNGRWHQLHPVGFWVYPNENVPEAVQEKIEEEDSGFSRLPPERLDLSLLAGFQMAPFATHTDVIRMTPIGSLEKFPDGPLPTSLHVNSIDTLAFLWVHNATFGSSEPVSEYTWTSKIPVYSEAQLRQASVSSDPTYTQLPSSVPDRVRLKAEEVTSGYSSPYLKAKALERYLSTAYPYAFADSSDDAPPEGRDPVDWFLFDHREGTCGVYSSAFVVMARSVGIPARVVSGWMIVKAPGGQTVYSDQGHQWAEVAFEGIGWVTFEPTGSGGAPSRVIQARGDLVHSQGGPIKRGTVIEIDQWPRETRKGLPFDIGGKVNTLSGAPVDGMEVEIFINETKEQGGWRLGTTETENGRFEIEVLVPDSFEEGSYQLIAHARSNDDYLGSWSDPEIGVYAGTEIELSGPSEISIDAEGTFRGRLTEEAGDPVGSRTIRVNIQGLAPFQVTTDDRGAFSFTRAFGRTGQRSVAVTFEQEGYMLGNEASLDVMVTMPSVLTIDAVDNVRVGEDFVINGTLRNIRGGVLAMQSIEVTLPDGEVASVQTRERGEFTVRESTERRGVYGIQASFAGDGILEPSKSGYTLSVFEPVFLELSGDREVQVGDEYVINGTLMDSNGAPLALKQIEITLPGEVKASALTDEQGVFRMNAVAEWPGRYGIEAAFSGEDVLERGRAGYTLSVTEPVFLELSGDREVQVGEEYVIRGSLQDSRGTPLSQRQVDVTLPEEAVTSVLTDELGEFELKGVTDQPGRYAIEATFTGDDLLEPGRSGYTLSVVELVLLDLSGDRVVRVGASYRLEGTLAGTDGEGLEGHTLMVSAGRGESVEVVTSLLGSFLWETTFEEEAETDLKVKFAGTDELAPIQASLSVTVGRAEIVVEEPEPVARGESITLRGVTLISGQTVPDMGIEVNGEELVRTNAVGAFVVRMPVPSDAELGEMELEVSALELEAATKVSVRVMATTSLLVTPVEEVRVGRLVQVEARLLDDHGVGIPGAAVHYAGYGSAVTDELGVALLMIDVPDEEGLTIVPLRVSYEGDGTNLPVSYLASLQVRSGGLGWLVWALLPVLLVLGAGGGYLGSRRFGRRTVLASARPSGAAAVASGPPLSTEVVVQSARLEMGFVEPSPDGKNAWQVGEEVEIWCRLADESGRGIAEAEIRVEWGDEEAQMELVTDRKGQCSASWTGDEPGMYRVTAEFAGTERFSSAETFEEFELRLLMPTRLEVSFVKPAEDLPEIWGVGEEVKVTLALLDDVGRGLQGRSVRVIIGDAGEVEELFTDDDGRCESVRRGADLGVYQVEAEFMGDEGHLPSEGRGQFEVVEFRDDIVKRYNLFLAEMRQKVSGISGKATPREVESVVVASGLPVDQRALEELIARFEEADYSEHDIGRRQFEAAYRAWRRLGEE